MCFEDFSLDSGEDSDDDDNIAYRTLLHSYGGSVHSQPSFSLFTCSHQQPDGLTVSWKVLLLEKQLFVHVSLSQLASFSKECFVSILDYAETTLHCTIAYIIVSQDISDDQRKQIFKAFRFMGFQMCPPGNPWPCEGYTFLMYSIDSSSSDSDDDN